MALTNYEINEKVKNDLFRGCFMRDELTYPEKEECGVLNLDTSENQGTHWTCWIKRNDLVMYYDSYGLSPPEEFKDYMEGNIIAFSNIMTQPLDSDICGYLCVYILNSNPENLMEFINLIESLMIKPQLNNGNYLLNKLKMLIGAIQAGNNSVINDATEILKYLYETERIAEDDYLFFSKSIFQNLDIKNVL